MQTKLRIVAGTSFSGAGPEARDASMDTGLRTVADKPLPGPAQTAHNAILACKLPDGTTIGVALHWLQGGYDVYDEDVIFKLGMALSRVGVHANENHEPVYDALGYIWEPAALIDTYHHLAEYRPLMRSHPTIYG